MRNHSTPSNRSLLDRWVLLINHFLRSQSQSFEEICSTWKLRFWAIEWYKEWLFLTTRYLKGKPIMICEEGCEDDVSRFSKHLLTVPSTVDCLSGILTVIPLQLMSFHLAVMRGLNVSFFISFFGYWIILSISGRFPTKLGKVGNSGITTIHSYISFLPLLSCFFINQHCNYTHIPCNIRSTLTTSATPYPPPSLHRAWS